MAASCRPRFAWVMLVLAFLVVLPVAVRTDADTDIVDEIDDPWAEADQAAGPTFGVSLGDSSDGKEAPKRKPQTLKQVVAETWEHATLQRLKIEVAILAFFVLYVTNIIVGRRRNSQIAKAFGSAFCLPGGIFDRNFAQVGAGESKALVPVIRESGSRFKVYCTGRRHCKALEATLDLSMRQDLFMRLLGLVLPWDDKVDLEVFMHEASMPQIVLAVATKKLLKQMLKEEDGEDDVRKLTRRLEVSREHLAAWPSDKLMVSTEHSALFYDIFSDAFLEQVFGKAAWEEHGKYFRMLHITSEQAYGSKDQKAVLRFSFRLPPPERMDELTRLLSAAIALVDIVGAYKLSPDQKKRAEKLRQDVGKKDSKDKERERQEAVEERRAAKRAEEQEKLRKMTPQQREKYMERQSKIESQRAQRKYVRKG